MTLLSAARVTKFGTNWPAWQVSAVSRPESRSLIGNQVVNVLRREGTTVIHLERLYCHDWLHVPP